MATFTILTRDGKRTSTSASNSANAPAPSLSELEADIKAAPTPREMADDELPPKVALQLPDVAAGKTITRGKSFRWSELTYWTGIALGTALAVGLIWTPKREPPRPMDEAPTWSAPNPSTIEPAAPAIDHSGAENAPAAEQAAAPGATQEIYDGQPDASLPQQTQPPTDPAAPPAPPATEPSGPTDGPLIHNGPARRAPEVQNPPPAGAGYVGAPQLPPGLRTASGPSPRWDGSSNHVRPSEAAPLGITTPVPQ